MDSKFFELDGFERAQKIDEPTILTSLGIIHSSLRRRLADDSFEEILRQPDSMFQSQSDPTHRKYLWETDQILAELSISKVDSKIPTVEDKYMICWRVDSRDSSSVLNCRVGFANPPHSFTYNDHVGDQWHDGAVWTNDDFAKEGARVSIVAIAGWYDLDVTTDHWGVYAPCVVHPYTSGLSALFAVVAGSVMRAGYGEPELADVLNDSQIDEICDAVDPCS